MQQIVNYYFQRPWSGVDSPRKPLSEITGVPEYFENWRYNPHPWTKKSYVKTVFDHLNTKIFKRYNLNQWLATYDLAIPPYTKNCLYLLPGCLNALTPKNRSKLAKREDYFFVKTHFKPFKYYFEGEYVVQMVRHPGPVFVSYVKLAKRFDLEQVIRGEVFVGSWSEWHQAWKDVIPSLGDRFLRLKYEDVLADKMKACEAIKQAIHFSYSNSHARIPSFTELQSRAPEYYGVGNSGGWEQKYSSEQKSLLYALHRGVMQNLGYT